MQALLIYLASMPEELELYEFSPFNCRTPLCRVYFYLGILLPLTFTHPLNKKSYKLPSAFKVASLLLFIVAAHSNNLLT